MDHRETSGKSHLGSVTINPEQAGKKLGLIFFLDVTEKILYKLDCC
ncbi:MAG: hypothetical protein HQL07_14905 [Nitrospirae bacterium]|nr:hypothetical protein [Magnetococcales bacterium]